MIVGAIVKLISNYILLGKIGVVGAPISTVLCYVSAASLNIFFTVKYVGRLPKFKDMLILPFISSIISVGASIVMFYILSMYLPMKVATIISIGFCIVLYFFVSLRLKSIRKEDILLIPKGEQILKLISKVIKL